MELGVYYLKLRVARLLWDEEDRLNDEYEKIHAKMDNLKRDGRFDDARRLRDDWLSRRRVVSDLSTKFLISQEGGTHPNDEGSV
jgi:hypothetical protein